MADVFVAPVFHVGGRFGRDEFGVYEYVDGTVHKLEKMDIDFVNYGDLVKLLESLGYPKFKCMKWYDAAEDDLELGLHKLEGDKHVNEMCDQLMRHIELVDEFHIYVEHEVDVPIPAGEDFVQNVEPNVDTVILEDDTSASSLTSSTDDGGYESAEDELYKPPPEGYAMDTDSEDEVIARVRGISKGKRPVVSVPKSRSGGSRMKGAVSKATKCFSNGSGSGADRDEDGAASPTTETRNNGKGVKFYKPIMPSSDEEYQYEYESETLHTPVSSDEEKYRKHAWPEFNRDYEFGEGHFELGTKFATLENFKDVVKDIFISEGREPKWIKVDRKRVRVGCLVESCGWLAHCSKNSTLGCFQVKTFKNNHSCGRGLGSHAADQNWLSRKIEKRLAIHPHMSKKEAQAFLKEDFKITPHEKMVYRALRLARERLVGTEKEQYAKMRGYLFELIRSNPRSTALIEVIPIPQCIPVFDKIYVCFEATKQGFKNGCRPMIHLDGCFLKTYFGGQLLSAVAQDANNQFYVIAYGVARSETKDSWKWFLNLLIEDLGDPMVHGYHFMSDQQKGLREALRDLAPNAPHRNCVMHIWKNFINRFKDMNVRDTVWECANQTTAAGFDKSMEKLLKINEDAHAYLSRFDRRAWVKAFFSHGSKVDGLTNNMCESWNAKIEPYRCKPILTMCEELRCYLMRRMAKHLKLLGSYTGKLAPVQRKRLDKLIRPSNRWTAEWALDDHRMLFQVTRGNKTLAVDLAKHTCSCNGWQLTGLPCVHSVAAITRKRENPEDFVHNWLCLTSFHATYRSFISPVPSEEYWTSTNYLKTEPPVIKRPIGRPKVHARKKDPSEVLIQGDKLKKSFRVTCSKCGEKGHNFKTCKGAASNPNWKPKTRRKQRKPTTTNSAAEIQISQSALESNEAPTPSQSQPSQNPTEASLS